MSRALAVITVSLCFESGMEINVPALDTRPNFEVLILEKKSWSSQLLLALEHAECKDENETTEDGPNPVDVKTTLFLDSANDQ
ncbi:hypothetical protein Y1Q_0023719 [Alligator mississippiensis]|uniref:Uncharacterized protein n=1 Tax=Alligator mississippiensis TaxID=8496 RepID=A0A151MJX4_ALLMI|nr:hypothetical protein Y1Q_0023719 [Alligator mississippiensis]